MKVGVGHLAVLVLSGVLMQGCGVQLGEDESERSWDSWDLTDPPTRADVGLAEGGTTVIYQETPADIRTVTVSLPEERVLTSQANSVSFSALGSTAAASSDPTTMDIGSGLLTLDEALDEFAASLRVLDQPSDEADDWYREAAAASGAERVECLGAERGRLPHGLDPGPLQRPRPDRGRVVRGDVVIR